MVIPASRSFGSRPSATSARPSTTQGSASGRNTTRSAPITTACCQTAAVSDEHHVRPAGQPEVQAPGNRIEAQ